MTAIQKTLPCPFCGGTKLKTGGDDKIVGTWCLTCEASGPNEYGSFEWNSRALAALDAETEVKATRGLADLSIAMAGDIIEIITGKPATPDQSAKVSLFILKCATTGALPFEILAALVTPEARS